MVIFTKKFETLDPPLDQPTHSLAQSPKRNQFFWDLPLGFIVTRVTFYICISAVLVDQHTTLEEVYIFFETAQYDQIERDVKVNTLILTSKDSAKLE